MTPPPETLHASAVAIWNRGVLITGASGSGKSGLALRLIALGATLVADDRVIVTDSPAGPTMSAPPQLSGLIEARGIGLLRLPYLDGIRPVLAVDMDIGSDKRLPPLRNMNINSLCLPLIAGKNVPNLEHVITAALNACDAFSLLDPERDDRADDARRGRDQA